MAFIVVVSLTDNNKYPTGIGNKLLFGIEFLTVVLFYSTDVAGIGHRSSLHVSSRCLPAASVVTGEDKRSHDLYSDNLRTCTISAYNNGGQGQLLPHWIVGMTMKGQENHSIVILSSLLLFIPGVLPNGRTLVG